MKLVTIDCREVGGRPGVVLPGGDILDLAAAPSTLDQAQWIPYSVVSVLVAGRDGRERIARLIDAVAARTEAEIGALREGGVLIPSEGTVLLPPVRRPGLVLVVDHLSRTYVKSPNAVAGHLERIAAPWQGDSPLECSGLLAAVIGRPLYKATPDEVAVAVAGFSLVLDFSPVATDDWQKFVESKQFPGASPMGPAIVTGDELGDVRNIELELSLNGVAVAADAAWPHAVGVAARIAEQSQRYGFRPGDVVCFEPAPESPLAGCQVRRGDAVRLSIDGIMSLEVTLS